MTEEKTTQKTKTRGFEKISSQANNNELKLPARSTKHSVAYDVFSPINGIIPANGGELKIHTGIKAYFQTDEGLFFYTRSGMGTKHGIQLKNNVAVFESDYYNNPSNEGEAIITLRNISDNDFVINKGDKFCQAVFQKVLFTDDDEAFGERLGGLGSTGQQ
jgi:dUTP pyrophosphatase